MEEDEYRRVLKLLEETKAELKTLRKSSAAVKSRSIKIENPRIGSWAWLTSSSKIANTMSGATITELEVLVDVMITCGGLHAYTEHFFKITGL